MTDFHMPDSYYDPPEYDGCEDCECEDPEYPEIVPCACGVSDGLNCDHDLCTCKCHDYAYPPED